MAELSEIIVHWESNQIVRINSFASWIGTLVYDIRTAFGESRREQSYSFAVGWSLGRVPIILTHTTIGGMAAEDTYFGMIIFLHQILFKSTLISMFLFFHRESISTRYCWNFWTSWKLFPNGIVFTRNTSINCNIWRRRALGLRWMAQ